jgi:hypothetical protein
MELPALPFSSLAHGTLLLPVTGSSQHDNSQHADPYAVIDPGQRRSAEMLTSRPEINADFPFRVKVFGIELSGGLLLLIERRDHDAVADIVIMKMEDRFVIATVISESCGALIDFRILDDDLRIRDRLAGLIADMSLDDEAVIDLVHRRNGWRPTRVKSDPASG